MVVSGEKDTSVCLRRWFSGGLRANTRTRSHLRNVLIMYKRTFLIKEGITANALNNHGNLAKRKRVDCHILLYSVSLPLSLSLSSIKKRPATSSSFLIS